MGDDIYYDPYDFDIDVDPYPVWKRMRDEAPLYYNEKYDFFALSRFDDVEKVSVDWRTYISGKGSVLEMIKSGIEMPPGTILFEDPPSHDVHRSLLSRVFTPRRINDLEPKVREFCARSLDPLVGSGGFDFIADLGAQMPMRTIGMLLGIPEEDQEAIRDQIDEGMRLKEGAPPEIAQQMAVTSNDSFAEYIDWRADHPSDDLMTELLTAEFEDEHGVTRTLTREEILGYVGLLAAAGNETNAPHRLDGKGARREPRPEADDRGGPQPGPQRDRGAVALRGAVTGAGALRHEGRRAPRPDGGRGQRHGDPHRRRQPRRAALPRP